MVIKYPSFFRVCWVLALVVGYSPQDGGAQVTFQSAVLENNLIGPKTLFRATVLNSGPECELWLEGDVRTRSGEMVLSFKADPVRLSSGVHSIAAADVVMRTFTYGASATARAVQQFQRLPGGDYRYCVRLRAPQGEAMDEYCDALQVDEFLILDLVQPWNKDTIDETRPALTWSISGSGPSVQTADVRLVLVPMDKGRGPAQAIAAERPFFMLTHVTDRTVPYPVGVNDLERGKCYAWQVERLQDGRVLDRSEPWAFCVKKNEVPVPMKYVRLEDVQPGSIYEVVDQRIYFRYDEHYASEVLQCSILKGVTMLQDPPVAADGAAPDADGASHAPKSIGLNLYELDLSTRSLAPGQYTLLVRNEKGRSYPLYFKILNQ